MALTAEQVLQLQQHLDINVIKHRPGGKGKLLKYIKGDYAIDKANEIFGFGQWGYKVVSRSHEVIDDDKKGRIEFYTADIELSVVGAAFPFPGDGVGIVTAPYTVEMHEKARKEAATDALKRALRHYGDQFGLSLYDEDDYVDIGNGTLVQVKEVQPGRQPQPKRVVEAAPARKQIAQPEPTPIQDQAPTPKALYNLGKEAGMWRIAEEFYTEVSRLLEINCTKDTTLTIEQRRLLSQIVEAGKDYASSKQEQAVEQPAQEKPKLTVVPVQPTSAELVKAISDAYDAATAEPAISEQQLRSIRKLSEYLNKPEPDQITALTDAEARQIIQQLTSEYRAVRSQAK